MSVSGATLSIAEPAEPAERANAGPEGGGDEA